MGMPPLAQVFSIAAGLWLLFCLYASVFSHGLSRAYNEDPVLVGRLVNQLGESILAPMWKALGEQGRGTTQQVLQAVAPSLVGRHPLGRFQTRITDVGGSVESCCCPIDLIESDQPILHHLLSELIDQPYFRYFHVNYEQPCPFWVEEHLCTAVASDGADEEPPCGICECPPDAVPELVRTKDERALVDTTLSPDFPGFIDEYSEHQWIDWDPCDQHMAYVDLQLNPERYTGYRGGEARQIWQIIYEENCFFDLDSQLSVAQETDREELEEKKDESAEQCMEERVFFRLISGLHGSTTVHLCSQHQKTADDRWLPNLDMFIWRLGIFPERIKNIYFNYIFMLRALAVLNELLPDVKSNSESLFATGAGADDRKTARLVHDFYQSPVLSTNTCASPLFDETSLFKGPNSLAIRDAFRNKFRNISRIMDCVACESCKLHAKLQVLGMGTALKLLFNENPRALLPFLQRNEIMALFQTAHKFSESIELIHQLRQQERAEVIHSVSVLLAFAAALVSLGILLITRCFLHRI